LMLQWLPTSIWIIDQNVLQVSLMYDFSGGDCGLEEGLARERIDLLAVQIGGVTSA